MTTRGVRPLERGDLEEVAGLYELVMRSGRETPAPGLADYLRRVLLDHPWADDEIPSLVYVDAGGRIVGFQGTSVRRALFDGRSIRIACGGQLVSHPDARKLGVGAWLCRAHAGGQQDVWITDTAGEPMRRIGASMGLRLAHLSCIEWLRVLRPLRFAERALCERRGSRRAARAGGLVAAIDSGVATIAPLCAPPQPPEAISEPLTTASLLEHVPIVGDHVRLRLAYDAPFLDWVFAELGRLTGLGRPVAQLVKTSDGRVLGWYLYLLQPHGSSRVLQIAARDRDVGPVLDHLIHDAWCCGAAAVQGRLEPRLLDPLAQRRCVMLYRGHSLVTSSDREILGALAVGDSLLTRLDSEWWLQDKAVDLGSP